MAYLYQSETYVESPVYTHVFHAKIEVMVMRVGDALQEPFWPEGLGINLEASYTRLTAPTWPRASPTSRAHGVAAAAWTWPQPRR